MSKLMAINKTITVKAKKATARVTVKLLKVPVFFTSFCVGISTRFDILTDYLVRPVQQAFANIQTQFLGYFVINL